MCLSDFWSDFCSKTIELNRILFVVLAVLKKYLLSKIQQQHCSMSFQKQCLLYSGFSANFAVKKVFIENKKLLWSNSIKKEQWIYPLDIYCHKKSQYIGYMSLRFHAKELRCRPRTIINTWKRHAVALGNIFLHYNEHSQCKHKIAWRWPGKELLSTSKMQSQSNSEKTTLVMFNYTHKTTLWDNFIIHLGFFSGDLLWSIKKIESCQPYP